MSDIAQSYGLESGYTWAAPEAVWARMGAIGQSHGLEWGGAWQDKHDLPHFEEPE